MGAAATNNMSSSVATALSDGLERLVEMSGAGGPGLGRESLPILESFLHATDLLVESAGTPRPSNRKYKKIYKQLTIR